MREHEPVVRVRRRVVGRVEPGREVHDLPRAKLRRHDRGNRLALRVVLRLHGREHLRAVLPVTRLAAGCRYSHTYEDPERPGDGGGAVGTRPR